MSLINEALKKAQTDRPSVNPNLPPPVDNGVPPQQPPPSSNRRRYLWGFILSILIVGLFTTTLSTFLIYQILGEEEQKAKKTDQSRLETVSDNVGELVNVVQTATSEKTPPTPAAAEPVVQPEPVPVAEVAPPKIPPPQPQPEVVQAIAPPVAVEVPVNPTPQPAAVPESAPEPQQQPTEIEPMVEEPVAAATQPAAIPQQVPVTSGPVENPATWGRLQNIEIRGIMSGGTKVMIFDADNNKTKTYRPGDLFDGTLSLKVATISSSAIIFEDHGGFRYTKSF